uniref:Uncharacterized protein n=1 Tax=Amphimedon queenslandica TaxID=400682 RepID=A0A1X7VX13_AMPQE
LHKTAQVRSQDCCKSFIFVLFSKYSSWNLKSISMMSSFYIFAALLLVLLFATPK